MKTSLSILSLLVALAAITLTLRNTPKIGYAETPILLSEFTEGIKARKEYEKLEKEWNANIKMLNDSLMSTMNFMKQNFEKLSKKDKEKYKILFEKRNDDYGRYTQAIKKKAQEEEQRLMAPVISKLNSYLKIWGSQNGYDMVFGTMSGGNVLQANEASNLTATILKDLNEHYKDLPVTEKVVTGTQQPMQIPQLPNGTQVKVEKRNKHKTHRE